MTTKILIAGFGGQGILFAGKFLANMGMLEGRYLSWLPSYGPEMRGGTANCSVVLSDAPIGSPIVNRPDILVAMNLPSLAKYEDSVVPGGTIFVDSTLIDRKVKRTDVRVFYVPATGTANEQGIAKLANMIIVGKMMKECDFLPYSGIENAVRTVVGAKHADLFDVNMKAIDLGYNFES